MKNNRILNLVRTSIIILILFSALSCENPLEDRVNELEEKLEHQELEQINQQSALDSLMLVIRNQNSIINSVILERQKMIDSLTAYFNQSLDSMSSYQIDLIDSLISEQNDLIDSVYANQQNLIEDLLASQVNSEFDETEVFNGICPQTWTDIDISNIVGKKKTFLIFRVDRISEDSDYIVFRPNGETLDWLSDDPDWIILATSSLSIINLGYAESGLIMINSDDVGVVEMRANIKTPVRVSVKLQFYLN